MFKKLGRALGSSKGGRVKVRLDVLISRLEIPAGAPESVAACRVVWSRGNKVQMTKLASLSGGSATWEEELSIIATLNRNAKGSYDNKTYEFTVQYPEQQHRFVSLGKATINLAQFAEARDHPLSLPLAVSLPGGGRATLIIIVTGAPVKGLHGEDVMSVISGVSGLSGSASVAAADQDLNGFEDGSTRGRTTPSSYPSSIAASSPMQSPAHRAIAAVPEDREISLSPTAAVGVAGEVGDNVQAHSSQQQQQQQQQQSDSISSMNTSSSLGGNSTGGDEVSAAAASPVAPGTVSAAAEQPQRTPATPSSRFGVEAAVSAAATTTAVTQTSQQVDDVVVSGSTAFAAPTSHQQQGGVAIDLFESERLRADEAEAVLEEAVTMLESERGERRQAEASAAQLRRDLDWAEKKAAKERADWEGRMKDAFRKMEQTVMLTERVQREKAELSDRVTMLAEENRKIKELVDPKAVEAQMSAAASAAKEAAERAATAEMDVLRARLREMEEFVEEADAKAFAATGRVATLQAQLAGQRSGSAGAAATVVVGDVGGMSSTGAGGNEAAWEEVKAAEERADALSLELEYAKAECRSLESELKSAKNEADRTTSAARHEAEAHATRAADYARQLEVARAAAAAAERKASQTQGRVVLLEDAVERSNLQAAELRQRLAAATAASATTTTIIDSSDKINSSSSPELEMAMRQVREVQDAAEARAAQLAATSRELAAAQESVASLEAELHSARQECVEAQRVAAARDDEVRHLREELKERETQRAELRQLQRDMATLVGSGAAATAAAVSRPGSVASLSRGIAPRPGSSQSAELTDETGSATTTTTTAAAENSEAVAAVLQRRVHEAESLASTAALQTADLVQQLATSQAELQDAATKIAEMREEIAHLRSSSDGELRTRIETLEREVVVARNRADVNALFREEHERIASELVASKLALAETQEEIVVLRRERFKAEEKHMSFASKLTSLEAKLYKKLSGGGSGGGRMSKRRGLRPGSGLSQASGESSRPSSGGGGGGGVAAVQGNNDGNVGK